MDEEFIRNRITELRLKKGVSEYQMSMDLGQNKNYVQAISSGRALPSMKSSHFFWPCIAVYEAVSQHLRIYGDHPISIF